MSNLDTVCPHNAALITFATAVDGWAVSDDMTEVNATAAAARDSAQATAQRFDDADVVWPANVADDIPVMRDGNFADASSFGAIAQMNSGTFIAFTYPDDTASNEAAQRIRSRLNLSADTVASCEGR
ncbi:hypothetical protein ABIB15_002531 [Marisediminicola sp. UYEF4]|uniref:hypothetical protein n=1 Tax=Marisediminicola sp. UYEF4 TaxID=1756384 RepID=UPI003392318F